MKNNSNDMLVYNEKGLLNKIKNFFKRIKISLSNKDIDNKEETHQETKVQEIKEDNSQPFIDNLKGGVSEKEDETISKEAFLKEIDGNEEMLMNLSIDRLEMLSKHYDEIIKKNKAKLEKIKKN